MRVPDEEFQPQLASATMRETQVAAFEAIKESGLLSRLRFLVYRIIYENQRFNEGVSSGEVDRILSEEIGTFTRSASPRLSELVRLGVIEEIGTKRCSETGQTVIAYRTTGQLPNDSALWREKKEPCSFCAERPDDETIIAALDTICHVQMILKRSDSKALTAVVKWLAIGVGKVVEEISADDTEG